MSDRHQILEDQEFWTRLEYDASQWLENSDYKTLRHFWIDGFVPESITDTKRGADVEGIAWVGNGPREQHQYRFVVCLPQKLLHRARRPFSIEQLSLDATQQTLRTEIVHEKHRLTAPTNRRTLFRFCESLVLQYHQLRRRGAAASVAELGRSMTKNG